MKKWYISMAWVMLLVLNSCSTYKTYKMELLKPAMVTPKSVNNKILFINNTISQPATIGQYFRGLNRDGVDTTYNIPQNVDAFYDMLIKYMTVRIQKEGCVKSIESLSAKDEGISQKTGKDAYFKIESLDKAQRAYFNKKTTACMMVSLDGLLLESIESCDQQIDTFPLERMVFVRTFWSVYDRTNDSLLLNFQRRDSLYWRVSTSASSAINKLIPSFESTLPEIADYVAGGVYRIFTPYWQSTERFFYILGNVQLKLAHDEVREGRWDKAAEYWQDVYKNGKGLNPYRAAVNMMLYCEQSGDVDGALMWANRAEIASKHELLSPDYYEWEAFKAWFRDLTLRQEEMERIIPYLGEITK